MNEYVTSITSNLSIWMTTYPRYFANKHVWYNYGLLDENRKEGGSLGSD